MKIDSEKLKKFLVTAMKECNWILDDLELEQKRTGEDKTDDILHYQTEHDTYYSVLKFVKEMEDSESVLTFDKLVK